MWGNFEQSPLEDETISNSFSSRGIFKISADEEIQTYPCVQSLLQNGKMVIAIDKNIVLLENELVPKCSFLSFNATIDVVAISNTGNLIIVGLQDGVVHGILIKAIPLFNLCINIEDVHMNGRSFTSIQELNQRFYISCANGSVYSLSKIDESSLESVLNISINDNEVVAFDENILEHVSLERLSTGRALTDVCTTNLIPKFHVDEQDTIIEPLLIAGTHNAIHLRSSTEDAARINIPDIYGGTKRIFNLESMILVLTKSGHLLEVCPITKLIYLPTNGSAETLLIDEMIIMECNPNNIELLVLTKTEGTNAEERTMKIIDYPSMKIQSEFDVPQHTWLVQQPKCSVNLYYLCGKNENLAEYPTAVEMMLVSETQPSERFKKLIAKGHLEEAEDFGKQFELDLQPIYEAKCKRALIELSSLSENNPELLGAHFKELQQLLTKIENKSFFINHYMVNMPTRHLLEKYLKELLKHLHQEYDENHILEITEQLHRIETLNLIDPYECNMDWQKFVYNPNLVKLIITLFKTDLPKASLLWKRHASALLPKLDDKELCKLLSLIPNNTEAFSLVQWLRQFVPTVFNSHPNMMPLITDWSIQKARALQYADHWPEIGLEFSTKVMDIFEEIEFMHSDMRRQHECNMGKLRNLVNALQDLAVLKKSYNLTITLDNYLQNSNDNTALCMLQRVHMDSLKSLVNDFLYPIFQERGQLPVAAIRQYISLLVANRSSLSTWLERAVACIELLHNEDDRLECAVLVLQNSPVPWPDTVGPLVKLRYSTHPLALKINTEYEIQVIKIMKVKYGWPADSAIDMNLNLFMLRIVKMDLPDMLQDIRTLTKAAPEIATSANFNCCYQLVQRGKLELAYEYFKTIKADKNTKYIDELIELFADILDSSTGVLMDEQVEQHKRLIEFYKLIAPHSNNTCQKGVRAVQNRFILWQQFQVKIESASKLLPLDNRRKLLDLGIANIMERSQATVNICKFIISEVGDLCSALDLPRVEGMCRISQRLHCLPLTCALAYTVLECVDCVETNQQGFIDLALELLSQQMQITKSVQAVTPSNAFLTEYDPLAFPLAYELLVRTTFMEQKKPYEIIELLKYLHIVRNVYSLNVIEETYSGRETEMNEVICKALDAAEIILAEQTLNFSTALNGSFETKPGTTKKRYSVSVFDEVDVSTKQPVKAVCHNERLPVVKFVSRSLLLLILETEPKNSLLLKLRHSLPQEQLGDCDSAREDFFCSMTDLIKAKMHDVWYIMAHYFLGYQQHNKCHIINADFVSLQMSRVFRNLLNQKDVNFIDLFVMLISDPHASALLQKLEVDMKTDQQRANLLTLAEMYKNTIGEVEQVEVLRDKRLKHYYYMEFSKQDPSIKGKFNADIDSIEQLLQEFRNKQLDVHLLERMSRDFDLDYQQMLITQVISILSAQELQYDIKTDDFGDEELVMISSVDNMRKLCQPYINEIKNTELLAFKLKQFIAEINIYFYELYLCVIELLMFIDAGPKEMQIWSSILHFLKHKMIKRRRNRPGQLETEMWQSEMGVLPKIARYRLPFKPIVEHPLKDILDNELSVDNCESWFPLMQMHTLLKGSTDVAKTQDYFCMTAVKNSIAEYKAKNNLETWNLQPTNNAFLQSILRLVKHIHNACKAFMILYFVANYAPEGADQVEASYECYKFALENNERITDPKYKEQLLKIKHKYPTLKTQHLLIVYGLTDEKLMRSVKNPTELIYNLYHHELVLKSSKLDINAVVREIGQLHGLDVEVMQFQLLQKWLSFTLETVDGTMLEETFFEDQNVVEGAGGDVANDAENVIRANYILNSWPKKKALQFLVGHIFPSDGSVNTSKQLQMYECFSKLNDGSASFDEMLDQRQYITIKCVHELKQLGYNCSLEKFASCNKIDILKTIWQRNTQNPQTLNILANICIGYDIYIARIWNGILKRMTMFNMVRELNALVDMLSCRPELLCIEGLTTAWEYVLLHPFRNAQQTRSFEQEEQLHRTLCRLQSCPMLNKLNLTELAELCILLERPHLAAVLLGFCKSDEQKMQIKKLLKKRLTDKVKKDVLELEDAGILPIIVNFAIKELEMEL